MLYPAQCNCNMTEVPHPKWSFQFCAGILQRELIRIWLLEHVQVVLLRTNVGFKAKLLEAYPGTEHSLQELQKHRWAVRCFSLPVLVERYRKKMADWISQLSYASDKKTSMWRKRVLSDVLSCFTMRASGWWGFGRVWRSVTHACFTSGNLCSKLDVEKAG